MVDGIHPSSYLYDTYNENRKIFLALDELFFSAHCIFIVTTF